MMKPSRGQLAKIHIAVKDLGMTDAIYRDVLAHHFGVESASKLSFDQAAILLDLFRQQGWKLKKKAGTQPRQKRRDGDYIEIKPGPAAKQQRKVLAMWNALGYPMATLHTRCKKQFGIERFEWVTDFRHLHVLITDLQKRQEK